MQANIWYSNLYIDETKGTLIIGSRTVHQKKLNGDNVYMVRCKMEAIDGTCKNSKGGYKQIRDQPKQIPIFYIDQMDGLLNVYKNIEKYLEVCQNLVLAPSINKRFFTGINGMASRFNDFFKRSAVSCHQIRKIVQAAATKNNVTGFEENDCIVTHSLRGTATQMLVDAGIPDTSIVKRTRHRSLESIRDYQNLRGQTGLMQQDALFPSKKSPDDNISIREPVEKKQKMIGNDAQITSTNFPDNALDLAKKSLQTICPIKGCLLYTSPSPRDQRGSRMPSSA